MEEEQELMPPSPPPQTKTLNFGGEGQGEGPSPHAPPPAYMLWIKFLLQEQLKTFLSQSLF